MTATRPSRLRRWWVKWRHNGSCPCAHSHGETLDACAFCYWCERDRGDVFLTSGEFLASLDADENGPSQGQS